MRRFAAHPGTIGLGQAERTKPVWNSYNASSPTNPPPSKQGRTAATSADTSNERELINGLDDF